MKERNKDTIRIKAFMKRYDNCIRRLASGESQVNGVCPKCGQQAVKRMGPYGAFMACADSACRYSFI